MRKDPSRHDPFLLPFGGWGWRLTLPLILGLLVLILAPQLSGADQEPDAARPESLRERIEELYEVFPVQGGVLLKPRRERLGVRSIEVSREGIAVNGAAVSAQVLRAWLGEEAELILELAALDPGARRSLFGFSEETPELPSPREEGEEGEEDEEAAESVVPPVPPVPPGPPVPPAPHRRHRTRSEAKVAFGGSVVVYKDESVREAVVMGGSLRVDGEVLGDAVVVGGSARINGRVTGELVVVGGGLYMGPDAEILGDVAVVGGRIHREPGARIGGEVAEVSIWTPLIQFSPWPDWRPQGARGLWREMLSPFRNVGDVMLSLIGLVLLALLVCLALLVARGPIQRIEHKVVTEPWKAGLVGLVAQLLFFPVLILTMVILVLSIVGCLLLVLLPFAILVLVVAAFLGYTAVVHRLGSLTGARFGWDLKSPYMMALAGLVLVQVWGVLGEILGMWSGPIQLFAMMLGLFSFLIQYVVWTVGIGGVLLSRFGRRGPGPGVAATPQPPGPPGGPPEPRLEAESGEIAL